ncbi:MAG TPA: family 78 glycoside hydrolase catalytic domain [Sphingomonas sp.]|nr:family 78 glycoside hydrolase catalytic domain [Sphingomonas sp.]
MPKLSVADTGAPGLAILDLRAEHVADLLGTEVMRPILSWRIDATERGVTQTRYRIRAAARPDTLDDPDALLWDSGEIDSADSSVPYGGPAPAAMQRLWWNVEIADDRGRTARSQPAWFEAGLLSAGDWHAQWIEAEDDAAAADRAAGLAWIWSADPLDPRPHGFRLDFDAPDDVIDAEILIAGKDELLSAWVNGAPATLPRLVYWGTLLPVGGATVKPGRNSLCVAVSAETEGFFPVDGGAMAALVRLHRRDGTIERLVSGPDWRIMADPPADWTVPGFDASGWQAAQPSGSRAAGDPRPAEPAMLLRTEFAPRAPVVAARLYATALGVYEARINGRAVSDAALAPEISVAREHVLYQSYDVTNLIAEGTNALGFTVADGFYAGAFGWRMERYGFGPAPRRLLAQLRLDYADGSHDWVATGPDWRIARSPVTAADIYGGETHDARLDRDGWDAPGHDDGGWRPARVGAAPPARLVAQTSPALRPQKVLRAATISEPRPGRFVFDFGQNFAGWARLRATGPAGTAITLRFAELLDADGLADQANLRLAEATDRFILRGDAVGETVEPRFTYHGFRYVEVEGYPGTPTPDDIEGIVVHSDCAVTGDMCFDHPLLQQIWNNTLWSQRSNFFAVPTDCPQRDERMGWSGDIQVFLDAAAFNMDVDAFIRRFLLEMRAAQRPDGGYPIVVPQPLSFPDVVTAGWSEAGIILPHGLWQRYGDTAAIDENWDAMERWMTFVARTNPDHIWRNDRELDLGDWLSVDAIQPDDETTPRVLCATAYWAFSAQLMAEMAEATGRVTAAARYRDLRAAIGEAFARELLAADGTAGNGSQASQVLALHMGLVPDDRRAAAAQILADDIRRRGMKLSTGFLGTPYLLDVLADAGRWEEVTALLLQTGYPSWGYMPSVGATTIWERWNGDVGDLSMNSYNHYAFGAVVGFFYRRLAGIAPAAPGFRRIAVRPVFLPAIGKVAARYESCMGTIATEVDGDEDGLSLLTLTVPANAIAEVELPAGRDWREDGHTLDSHPDVRNFRHEDAVLRFEVGSGSYRFAG